jgi:uncharacterized membrane protein
MEDQVLTQYVLAGLAILLGVVGWVVPYRFNPLRLKKFVAGMLSEEANLKVPKVVGTIFIIGGVIALIVTMAGGTS